MFDVVFSDGASVLAISCIDIVWGIMSVSARWYGTPTHNSRLPASTAAVGNVAHVEKRVVES